MKQKSVSRDWLRVTAITWTLTGTGAAFLFPIFADSTNSFFGQDNYSDLRYALWVAFAFGVAGFMTALGQFLNFQDYIAFRWQWIILNLAAWTLAGGLVSVGYEFILEFASLLDTDLPGWSIYLPAATLICLILAALMIGLQQWLVLRCQYQDSQIWIMSSVVAWTLCLAMSLLGLFLIPVFGSVGCFQVIFLFPVVGGIIAGKITGDAFDLLVSGAKSAGEVTILSNRSSHHWLVGSVWLVLFIAVYRSLWTFRGPDSILTQRPSPSPIAVSELPMGCPPACAGAVMVDRDLSMLSLSGADLSKSDLSRCLLTGMDLSGVNLHFAILELARLDKVNFTKADLRSAHLDDANLAEASLEYADLSYAVARWVDLSGADLTGAKMNQASMMGAILFRANLSGADLRGTDLRHAILNGADLSDANLYGVRLEGARHSASTRWPVDFMPPAELILMDEPCYTDDIGTHCYPE